jgi:hypothetical protein
MNRRVFFSFLPAAPFGALMAAEAMAKAPPASMAPDKALMTLAAHKPPPPPPPPSQLGESFAKYPKWGEYLISKEQMKDSGYLTFSQFPVNNKLTIGKGMEVEADHNFDSETKVAMSVGKDGHLWLKINDEWKRIVTE